MTLEAYQLQLGYGRHTVVPATSLRLEPAAITCLIGPNGCGKSTLLRGLAGLQAPQSGHVELDGKALPAWPPRALARALAVLPQSPAGPDGLSVLQLVRHGRYPHQGLFGALRARDHAAVDWALEVTGLAALRGRALQTLSGGERQRAWIALALAQQAPLLLLDEPTTYLDIGHQIEVMELLRTLNRAHGMTIAMVLHDLNQASQYADRLLVMRAGRIVASGAPAEVVSAALLRETFGIGVELVAREDRGRRFPYSLPLSPAGA
ncbi:MAG: ABC transporter ATP-binding protein [Janthinobacterium sp.]|jgi:ABC-type cobalamin/Fe3+-siderophores transport system ATPase subunit